MPWAVSMRTNRSSKHDWDTANPNREIKIQNSAVELWRHSSSKSWQHLCPTTSSSNSSGFLNNSLKEQRSRYFHPIIGILEQSFLFCFSQKLNVRSPLEFPGNTKLWACVPEVQKKVGYKRWGKSLLPTEPVGSFCSEVVLVPDSSFTGGFLEEDVREQFCMH